MKGESTGDLLDQLEAEVATTNNRGTSSDTEADARARQFGATLLDALVTSGLAAGTSVQVNGITYRFGVDSESVTDTPNERREDAMVTAGRDTLARGLAHPDTYARFVRDFPLIAAAFAKRGIEELDQELHPKSSWIGRVEVACATKVERLLGNAGGTIDEAVEAAASSDSQDTQDHVDLRPVDAAAHVVMHVAAELVDAEKLNLVALITTGAAALLGAPVTVILVAVGVGISKEVYDHFRHLGDAHHLAAAIRAQIPIEDRLRALETLESFAGQAPHARQLGGEAQNLAGRQGTPPNGMDRALV